MGVKGAREPTKFGVSCRRLSSHQQRECSVRAHRPEAAMLGVVATIKVKPGMESQFEAVA
jgi:hypothetical protein